MVFGWGISRPHVGYMSFRRHSRRTKAHAKTQAQACSQACDLAHFQEGRYSAAYKIAWKQIPPDERRARPEMSLRIHASIRRQLKAGANNPDAIAFVALNDALVTDTQ